MAETAAFVTEDQSRQLALLAAPATHGLGPDGTVDRIDTHASAVFLGPDRVLKLKRAVRFDFMDLSTVGKRRAAVAAEVTLNRRTAPDLYLGMAPIEAVNGTLTLGPVIEDPADIDHAAPGNVVDWVTVMRRFDTDTLFDRQAEAGSLDDGKLADLAGIIAAFHAAAAPVADIDWPAAAAGIARGNVSDMVGRDGLPPERVEALEVATEARLAADTAALAARGGAVRRCHGDLHLRNICEIDGRPTLFDCIDFNEAFSAIDPLYDLAFLLMDLEHRGLRASAALVRDRYLEAADEVAGTIVGQGLMPLYLSMRAAVRAKVTAAGAAVQDDPDRAEAMRAEARGYLEAAIAYPAPPAPRLIAVGGFSGTGKSTLARAIAPALGGAPGAAVLRSDRLRKARFGVDEAERLPGAAYATAVSRAVYADMEARARDLLDQGVSVIADATFTHPDSRARIAAVAADAGVPFAGLWLEAPASVLEARVAARRGDASDADAAVVRAQRAAGAGDVAWPTLATGEPVEVLARRALERLGGADGAEESR
ncbi:AAA family ATPase [Marivibrio halodurans]|uniref:AAA family ATPase n=1 Tax=Marivibrio halodurans TaxID=2039722 RepID=A0A8J7SJZ5_9PROT|nr:bifunctional aminoglycoside phosphotransferase/ATP-binding protein [Marivibrio halodurans]MBP5858098.1 AAA family ATPase [Marivibrio halodurans]